MSFENHLFIIWHHALSYSDKIIDELSKDYSILDKINLNWSTDKYFENMSRFYSKSLTNIKFKVDHCGIGSALLILVKDKETPSYQIVETSRGHARVNIKQFEMKERLRKLVGGGHLIHGTNDPTEFKRDLSLLLGLQAQNFFNTNELSQPIEQIGDLAGAYGWKSYEELFFVLNHSCNYVVMRNFRDLLEQNLEIKDIDILVENIELAKTILNARKSSIYNFKYEIDINDKSIDIDLRVLGDNYYCYSWQKRILEERVQKEFIYIPNEVNYRQMLAYHFFIHKSYINPNYVHELSSFINTNGATNNILEILYQNLIEFMNENRYHFIKPLDDTVNYDLKYVRLDDIKESVKEKLFLDTIKPIIYNWKSGSNSMFFEGFVNEKKYFIKVCFTKELFRRELAFLKESGDCEYVPKLFRYIDNEEDSMLMMEFYEGEVLSKTLENKPNLESLSDLTQLVKDKLDYILKDLYKKKLIHRDITPSNIMILKDNAGLILLDWQFVVSPIQQQYSELQYVKYHLKQFRLLGSEKYQLGEWTWSDQESVKKILADFGIVYSFGAEKKLMCYYNLYPSDLKTRLRYKLFPAQKQNLLFEIK